MRNLRRLPLYQVFSFYILAAVRAPSRYLEQRASRPASTASGGQRELRARVAGLVACGLQAKRPARCVLLMALWAIDRHRPCVRSPVRSPVQPPLNHMTGSAPRP